MMMQTWEATVKSTPLRHIGSKEECERWAENMIGSEITVTGKDGTIHVIGLVSEWQARNLF
jgi:rRNA processing protein Krr1/Pno1